MLALENQTGGAVAGLDGGTLRSSPKGIKLAKYSITPGIEVTATLRPSPRKGRLTFTGPIAISGRAAAAGTLDLTDTNLAGKLDKHTVHAPVTATSLGNDSNGNAVPAASSLSHA